MTQEHLDMMQTVFQNAVHEAYAKGYEDGKKVYGSLEDQTFKTEKRVAEIGERILIVNASNTFNKYKNGDIGTVNKIQNSNPAGVWVNEWDRFVYNTEYEVIIEPEQVPIIKGEPETREGDYVRPNYTINHSHLKSGVIYGPVKSGGFVRSTNNPLSGCAVYSTTHNRTRENVEVFEVVEDLNDYPLPKELTPNEQRGELVQRAKKFVEGKLNINGYIEVSKGGILFDCIPEFIVNTKNRMVTVLLRGYQTKKIYAKGIAKCMPGEVFNEWIGKAIALARALEIEVLKEFLNAVQPTKIIEGMEILMLWKGEKYKSGIVESYDSIEDKGQFTNEKIFDEDAEGTGYCAGIKRDGFKIIDDTNAVYADDTQ